MEGGTDEAEAFFPGGQIIGILKEAEAGAVVTQLCSKHGVSRAPYYAWKAKHGGLEVSDAKRLRAAEEENARLERLLADTLLVHDQLATGRRFRVLHIVDGRYARVPGGGARHVDLGRRVVRELGDLIARRGAPQMIVSDNGTELTSNAVLAWSGDVGVEWHYIAPGKPTQNGFVER